MFITNNHASFHLWLKQNLVKYQEVSKYYVHDCSLKILLALYKNNVDCYGTLRKNKGLPRDVWLWKPKKKLG